MEQLVRQLVTLNIPVRTSEPLARHTSFKVGGPAALFAEPRTVEELRAVLSLSREQRVPSFLLGGGTNLLVSDKGFPGVVIRLAGEFTTFYYQGLTVVCGAGVQLSALAMDACRKGFSNLEFAVGIPGTLGGALVMNAGAHGGETGRTVLEAHVLDRELQLQTLTGGQLSFVYRQGILPPGAIVCRVIIGLAIGRREEIQERCRRNFRFRRERQPRQPNAGSVFKNPPGQAAGRLLEEAGLKGLREGGAMISPLHANFIVNCGNATSADILALIERARGAVREKYGVDLELEIGLLGE
jgi:UDP-N-acetylmuramate dehydrogenase